MNTQEKALWLSDYYQQVADGGQMELVERKTWLSDEQGPDLDSEPSMWRIKPRQQVVDLSVLIASQIDCEFWDDGEIEADFVIEKLTTIVKEEFGEVAHFPYRYGSYDPYKYCHPRMNHVHAWQGGECPLPEGLKVKIYFRDGSTHNGLPHRWSNSKNNEHRDVIAFEVLGTAENFCWPWEAEKC